MAQAGLDALLLLNPTTSSTCRAIRRRTDVGSPHYLVMPARRAVPWFHEGHIAKARKYGRSRTCARITRYPSRPSPSSARCSRTSRSDEVRDRCELGFDQRIRMPQRVRAAARRLAPARFEDAGPLLWRLRMIEVPGDLAALREACRITTDALERTILSPERVRRTGRPPSCPGHMTAAGATDPWVAIAAGRGNYDLATGVGHGQILEPGDMMWSDTSCRGDLPF